MAALKIESTDTLNSGFRVKYNDTVDTLIIGNGTIDNDGIIRFPKFDGSFWELDIREKFPTTSSVSSLVNPAIRQATDVITGQVRKATVTEIVDGSTDFGYVSAAGLKYALNNFSLVADSPTIGDNLFENGLIKLSAVDNTDIGISIVDSALEETNYLKFIDGLWEGKGGFAIRNNEFKTSIVNDVLTNNNTIVIPDRNLVINDWESVFNKIEGTTNFLLKFSTDASSYEESLIFDDGTNIGIGRTDPTYKLDVNGTGRFAGEVQFDTIPLCSVNATSANQLVNYQTVLALASGIKYDTNKVKTIGFTNVTLSGNQTISGYATSDGDRLILNGQTDASENGIWITDSGSWTRDPNYDSSVEIVQAIHTVESGTYAGYKYINTNTGSISVGTDDITYTEFSNLVESDPIFTASVAYGISGTNVTNWNTAYANYLALSTAISGTINYIPKFSSGTTIGNSQIFDNGTSVGINTTSPSSSYKLHVNGNFLATQGRFGTSSLGINILNYFGIAPRVASTADMDFFATNNYYWYTSGDLQQMRLTTTGLKIGTGSATEKLSVTGNITLTGVIKNSGTAPSTGNLLFASSSSAMTWRNFVISDIKSIGVDHSFIKSNGTSLEWAVINTGELSDKNNIVMYGTYEGERGFKLYHDLNKEIDAGLFFANADTGILGIHSYGWDGTNQTEHGIQIDEDGHIYHRKINGTRVRFLTTDDSLGGGTYQGSLPISVLNGVVSITKADSATNGYLSKEDWTTFNSKLADGGTITDKLKFNQTKELRFLSGVDGSAIGRFYSTNVGSINTMIISGNDSDMWINANNLYLNSDTFSGGFTFIENVAFDLSDVSSLSGGNAKFQITSLGSGKYKAKLISA